MQIQICNQSSMYVYLLLSRSIETSKPWIFIVTIQISYGNNGNNGNNGNSCGNNGNNIGFGLHAKLLRLYSNRGILWAIYLCVSSARMRAAVGPPIYVRTMATSKRSTPSVCKLVANWRLIWITDGRHRDGAHARWRIPGQNLKLSRQGRARKAAAQATLPPLARKGVGVVWVNFHVRFLSRTLFCPEGGGVGGT